MPATTTNLKVADYRDLIDRLSQWHVSLQSAATGDEQRREAMTLRRAVDDLKAATCRTASEYDRQRANRVLANAETLLARRQESFKAADANLQRMAFGAEWR